MNSTLVTAFWRQRLTSPIRMVLLGLGFGVPLIGSAMMRGSLAALGDSTGLVLIFAVGMIGQDVSSGVLHLLCARPVRRFEYVFSRWFAVGTAAALVSLVQVAVAAALMARHPGPSSVQDLGLFAAQRVLECFGLAAVFALLSSLIGGVGDIALYLIGTIVIGLLELAAQTQHWTAVARAAGELQGFLTPKIALAQVISSSPVPFFPFVSYLSTVALCLALAVLVMNRKELSYASG